MSKIEPRIVVFSSLYPNSSMPRSGLFIRERMRRVAEKTPLVVVSPQPWFPLQSVIRYFKPGYRQTTANAVEIQNGVTVYFPRFFSLPLLLRRFDGFFMAISCLMLMRRLKKEFAFNVIDAHFANPDGLAATMLGRWLSVPVTITMRGTEVPHSLLPDKRKPMIAALTAATHVFSVSDSLRQLAIGFGIDASKTEVVGNGVDMARFHAIANARQQLDLSLKDEAPVLITVGGLVERKGFHRVIACLPELLEQFPDLHYLIVGGPSAEGDWSKQLAELARELALEKHVHFLGSIDPDQLKLPLSAANVFVLSTRNEGWANVILEAMACGLPVVASDVGGNREVVPDGQLGTIVPFDDHQALTEAIRSALAKDWDRQLIIKYAKENSWDSRVEQLLRRFGQLVN